MRTPTLRHPHAAAACALFAPRNTAAGAAPDSLPRAARNPVWGRVGHLTQTQAAALLELQKQQPGLGDREARPTTPPPCLLSPSHSGRAACLPLAVNQHSTHTCAAPPQALRYLRARAFCAEKAAQLYLDSREWRRTNKPWALPIAQVRPYFEKGAPAAWLLACVLS